MDSSATLTGGYSVAVSPQCAAVLLTGGGLLGSSTGMLLATIIFQLLGLRGYGTNGITSRSWANYWQKDVPDILADSKIFHLLKQSLVTSTSKRITFKAESGSAEKAETLVTHTRYLCQTLDAPEWGSYVESLSTSLHRGLKKLLSYISSTKDIQQWSLKKLKAYLMKDPAVKKKMAKLQKDFDTSLESILFTMAMLDSKVQKAVEESLRFRAELQNSREGKSPLSQLKNALKSSVEWLLNLGASSDTLFKDMFSSLFSFVNGLGTFAASVADGYVDLLSVFFQNVFAVLR